MPIPNGTSSESSSGDADTTLDVAKAAVGDTQDGSEHETDPSSSEGSDAEKTPAKEPEKWDPLAVVKKAVEDTRKIERPGETPKDGAEEQGPDGSSKSEDGQNKKQDGEDLGDITEEELASYKPKTRKRIEGLLEDRQKLNDQLAEAQPQAEQYQQLTDYMRQNKLGSEEFADLMVVGAMAKSGDPEQLQFAIKRTREFLNDLELAAGAKLPEDLQKKVDEGHLDAESAKEVATSRVASKRAENIASEATQQTEEVQTNTKVQTVNTAISNWQRGKVSSDPDYHSKQGFLQTEIALLVSKEKGGRVLDEKRALELAEKAYENVTNNLKKAVPAKTPEPKKVIKSSNPPGNLAALPQTALEAARAAVKK